MLNNLLTEINKNGDKAAIIPISRINDLNKDIEALKKSKFRNKWTDWLISHGDIVVPDNLNFKPQSLISVITPSPKVIIGFIYKGKLNHLTIPAGYADFNTSGSRVLNYITAYLKPLGFTAEIYHYLPHKMLAVHSGLTLYGRNNICYNEEFGSYMNIYTYLSDIPASENKWYPLRRMEMCSECKACVSACPTNAIEPEKLIIDAGKCLTDMNEQQGEFPDRLDKSFHNSIVGCTKCQDCCPCNIVNRDNTINGAIFNEDETIELINYNSEKEYSASLTDKIKTMGYISTWDTRILSRNISALLN